MQTKITNVSVLYTDLSFTLMGPAWLSQNQNSFFLFFCFVFQNVSLTFCSQPHVVHSSLSEPPGKLFTPSAFKTIVWLVWISGMFYFLLQACKLMVVVPLYHDQWVCCTVVNHKWHLTAVGWDFTGACVLFTWNGVYKILHCLAVLWSCRAIKYCPGISGRSHNVRYSLSLSVNVFEN